MSYCWTQGTKVVGTKKKKNQIKISTRNQEFLHINDAHLRWIAPLQGESKQIGIAYD